MDNIDLIHFSNRTSYGDLSYNYLNKFKYLNRFDAIEKILLYEDRQTLLPSWYGDFFGYKNKKDRLEATEQLVSYWLREMMGSSNPMLELMSFFWHNHFATSVRKVKEPSLMLQQNLIFRTHCIGNFADLLHDICVDPAMGIFLDFSDNKKGALNENFARELLELYTMGEGNLYSENDIEEIARAFTGIRATKGHMKVKFVKKYTDFGEKTILGEKKNFSYKDVINLILAKDQTVYFISQKLWDFFISISMNSQDKQEAFRVFKASNLEIRPLLSYILGHDKFWTKKNIFSKVKSPIELFISSLRTMDFEFKEKRIHKILKNLEQVPFSPPAVNGWEDDWLNTQSLPLRNSLLSKAYKTARNKKDIYIPKEYNDEKNSIVSNDFQLK